MLTSCLLTACGDEHEPMDNAYVHFLLSDGTSQAVVTSDVNAINTYYVFLSSRTLDHPLIVDYEVIVGDGLTPGRDFELLNTKPQLVFQPGVFDMPIRIRWIPNALNPERDNSLTIRLTNSNLGLTLGMPGPDQRLRELRIIKR